MLISLLPLDSRPCTYQFPAQLAAFVDVPLSMPPMTIMDQYKTPSEYREISAWLEAEAAATDILIVSVDQLLYGGLLASRAMHITLKESLQRLRLLKELKSRYPRLVLYAFNIIMRTSVSTLDAKSLVWWQKVNEYSHAAYQWAITQEEVFEKRVQELVSEIPPEVLKQYLEARERNHAINEACIQLAAEGVITELLLLQEDSAPEGLQKPEQMQLAHSIETHGLNDRVFIQNGTDEAACEMLAKAVTRAEEPMKVWIEWLGGRQEFIALYEDRPFVENLCSHLKAVGITAVDESTDAEGVIFIHAPKERQVDSGSREPYPDYTEAELEGFAEKISQKLAEGTPAALLDVAYANGGDGRLLNAIGGRVPLVQLAAYSGWNTSSNALGTLLAQLRLTCFKNSLRNKSFTAERVLDDCIYQSWVRPLVQEELRQLGEDIWNICDRERAHEVIANTFLRYQPNLHRLFGPELPLYQGRLCWNRLFELEVHVKDWTHYKGGDTDGKGL